MHPPHPHFFHLPTSSTASFLLLSYIHLFISFTCLHPPPPHIFHLVVFSTYRLHQSSSHPSPSSKSCLKTSFLKAHSPRSRAQLSSLPEWNLSLKVHALQVSRLTLPSLEGNQGLRPFLCTSIPSPLTLYLIILYPLSSPTVLPINILASTLRLTFAI